MNWSRVGFAAVALNLGGGHETLKNCINFTPGFVRKAGSLRIQGRDCLVVFLRLLL